MRRRISKQFPFDGMDESPIAGQVPERGNPNRGSGSVIGSVVGSTVGSVIGSVIGSE